MKVRCTVNDRGELVTRGGDVIGRVVGLMLDLEPASSGDSGGDIRGGGVFLSKQEQGKQNTTPIAPSVSEIWAHYDELIGHGRRRLGAKQIRDIERALTVRDVETIKAAITGLGRSPHHNGQNDQATKYLDIRYAVRGNGQRGESNEERIDRMADLAAASPTLTRDRGVLQGRIDDLKAVVRAAWHRHAELPAPTADAIRDREQAMQQLYGLGIVTHLTPDGRPSFTDLS